MIDPDSKKVLFITTYKSRDFEGNGLVGWYLKNKYNVESYFINGYDVKKRIVEIKPSMLVMDHLVWDHKKALAKWASKMGIKVVLLFTEGYYQDKASFDKIFGHPVSQTLGVESYFVWNQSMIDRVKELVDDPGFIKKFVITGCPRFDFLMNEELKLIIEKREEFQSKYETGNFQKIITYMSTTPYQGYSFEKFERRYKKKAGYSDEKIKTFYSDQQKQFANHTKIIRDIAIKNPGSLIFYKTHPSEAYIGNYEKIFGDIANIKLIINENVRPFLFYSDLLIQRNCTTALEAWLLGKPVIQLDDDNYHAQTYPEHHKYSYIIKDTVELDSFIKSDTDKNWERDNVEIFLKNIFYKLDGNSYQRVGDEIAKILERITYDDKLAVAGYIDAFKKKLDTELINRIKDRFGIKRETTLRPRVYLKRIFNRKKQIKNTANEVSIPEPEVLEYYKKLDHGQLTDFSLNA